MWAVILSLATALASGALVLVGGAIVLERLRLSSTWILRKRLADHRIDRPSDQTDPDAQILRLVEERRGTFERLRAVGSLLSDLEAEAFRVGLRWSSNRIASYMAAGFVLGILLTASFPWWFILSVGVGGASLPIAVIRFHAHRRQRLIESQIPEALDMLISALRAGLSLYAGMQFVAREMPAPVGTEFGRVHDEQRLGIDLREALTGFQARLGSLDARMVVLAILIQRETGGNLAEVLANIATVIRERMKFRDHVAVLTSESRVSAYMLSVLPVLLFFAIQTSNPQYVASLTETVLGRGLLLYGILSLVVGVVMVNRFARIES